MATATSAGQRQSQQLAQLGLLLALHEVQTCKKCTLPIYEGHAYELGDDRWHIDCFKCLKCYLLLGCNLNFLVLGNGNLICSNCLYNCKQCGKKIDDLAILTGDQAYCSNCFKCRLCKLKIEDLRYARTSKGLFCMDCHEKLMAKKKKYDEKKRLQQFEDVRTNNSLRNSFLNNYMLANNSTSNVSTDIYLVQNPSLSSLQTKNKVLPLVPTALPHSNSHASSLSHTIANTTITGDGSTPSSATTTEFNLGNVNGTGNANPPSNIGNSSSNYRGSSSSIPPRVAPYRDSLKTEHSGENGLYSNPGSAPQSLDRDFQIEEVVNYTDDDDDFNEHNAMAGATSLRKPVESLPYDLANLTPAGMGNPKGSFASVQDTRKGGPATPEQNQNTLQPAVDITTKEQKAFQTPQMVPETPSTVEETPNLSQFQKKNILILLPNQFHDNEFHNANEGNNLELPTTQTLAAEEPPKRTGCTSPYAKANRQARVMETNDTISSDALEAFQETPRQSQQTPRKSNTINSGVSLPPPRMALPSTPVKKSSGGTPGSTEQKREKRPEETTPREVKGLGLEGIQYENSLAAAAADLVPNRNQSNVSKEPSKEYRDIFHSREPSKEMSHSRNSSKEYRDVFKEYSHSRESSHSHSRDHSREIPKDALKEYKFELAMTPRSSDRTPAVTNLEETDTSQPLTSGGFGSLSRKNTLIKTPKLSSLKHKRSISGGSSGNNILNKFNFFKSNKDDGKGHSRHVSEGSIQGAPGSASASAYLTPTVPENQSPQISNAIGFTKDGQMLPSLLESTFVPFDGNVMLDLKQKEQNQAQIAKQLQSEVADLAQQRLVLDLEVKKLRLEKQKLNESLKFVQQRISNESALFDNMIREIAELERNKKKLLEVNQALMEQNHQIESNMANLNNDVGPSRTTDLAVRLGGSILSATGGSTLVAGAPYLDIDEPVLETQKATRLKFWRRPKLGFNPVPASAQPTQQSQPIQALQLQLREQVPQAQQYLQSQSRPPMNGHLNLSGQSISQVQGTQNLGSGNSKISQSYSSNAIQLPTTSPKLGNAQPNQGNTSQAKGKFSKLRSTNILDSFLSGGAEESAPVAPLFGSTIQERADFEREPVPLIISRCLAEVEHRGLDMEGIYRISGGNSATGAIESAFGAIMEKDDKQMSRLEELLSGDINAVTTALKRYLRKLPDPLIPFSLYDAFIDVGTKTSANADKRILEIKSRVINEMPPANRQTLRLLCQHLALVSSYSAVNRMGYKNLSVVFAPTIARDQTGEKEMIDMGHRNNATELILVNWERIFE